MSENPITPKASPWRQAFREARPIVLLGILIAITYNIFAATRIPWLRESRAKDTTATASNLDTTAQAGDTGAVADLPITAGPDSVDTASVPAVIDTTLSQKAQDSIRKAQQDSVKLAKQEAARVRDSVRNAEGSNLLAQMATMTEIQTDMAKKLFDSKQVLFIDARPESQFEEGHITGSINVYAEQWQSQIPELIKIPRDKPIVTYCGGGDECELSHDLAASLKSFGFKTVVVYMGGIKDWTAKKYPLTAPQK